MTPGDEHGGTPRPLIDQLGARVRAGAGLRTRFRRRFLIDAGMLALGAVAAGLYDGSIAQDGLPWAVLFIVVTFLNRSIRRVYDARLHIDPLDEFWRIVAATSTSAILVVAARVLAGRVDGASTQAVRLWLWATILLATGRLLLAVYVRREQRAGRGQLPTVIVGADAVGRQIARRLVDHPELGLRPVGFVDEDLVPRGDRDDDDVPVLGTIADLEEVVAEHAVQQVVIGFAAAPPHRLTAAVRACRRLGVRVSTVPRLYEEVNRRVEVEHLGGIPLLSSRPADLEGWQFAAKSAIDRTTAALLLVVLSPLLVAIAVMVKLTSPGPVFYRQPRVSLDGCEFTMFKFRTMVGAGEQDGQADAHWAAHTTRVDLAVADLPRHDGVDRSTPVGRVLRRLSLDELPQLLNVLFGDMSLVGPRPERTSYVQLFNEHVYRYPDRHRVKSGLTGWAQVHGLRGETSLADRVEWDNYYIENWSLWLDLKILLMTTPALIGGVGGRHQPGASLRLRPVPVGDVEDDSRAREGAAPR